MDLLKLFTAGGFAMYPLLVCSILVWAIFFDKTKKLLTFKKQIHIILIKGGELIREDKIHEAKGLCHNMDATIKSPYLELFLLKDKTREICAGKMIRKIDEIKMELTRSNWLLATIAAISPFLGLLGTVTGIIRSFESMAISGKSGFSVIAPGLAEALITTAFGIIVAIMTLIIFNYFQMKMRELLLLYKNGLEDLMDEMEVVYGKQ